METGGQGKRQQTGGAATVEGRPWADLNPDLLLRVSGGERKLSLRDIAALRSVCAPWRSVVLPVSPSLFYTACFPEGESGLAAVFTLPSQQTLELSISLDVLLSCGSTCVGASNGWLAVEEVFYLTHFKIRVTKNWRLILVNPLTGKRIQLPSWSDNYKKGKVTKVVFAPNPRKDDFTAVAICHYNKLAFVKSGDMWWEELTLENLMSGDKIVDVLYHEDGKIYCVTRLGNVSIIHLPEDRVRGTAKVENLPLGTNLPFSPDVAFAPPFSAVNDRTDIKNLFFCGGNLYQVWRNSICTMISPPLPDGSQCRVVENDIFVVRYNPGSQPCWSPVKDLGGYSVFIGKNNSAAVREEGVSGVKANCVYWIGGSPRAQAMVFDLETRISTPCAQAGRMELYLQRAICWYIDHELIDVVSTNNSANQMEHKHVNLISVEQEGKAEFDQNPKW